MATCQRDHRYNQRIADLPDNQGGAQRHKCCGCAYDMGYEDGINNSGMRSIDWGTVDESQAGYSRHKNASDAYVLGYADGSQNRRNANTDSNS